MTDDLLREYANKLTHIAQKAGDEILAIYNSEDELDVQEKSDTSPLTQADLAAHRVIEAGIKEFSDLPILSEEGGMPSYEERASWTRYWLVDPLDGTKEFIQRNGEFTVNIALIEAGVPLLGCVYVPVKGQCFWGGSRIGAWLHQAGVNRGISTRAATQSGGFKVVGSRRHGAEALERLVKMAERSFGPIETVSMGSSLKMCAVASGDADWYPRLAPTSEWDTAAAHAIVIAAGGDIWDEDLKPLRYNQKESILNPHFHCIGDTAYDWSSIIAP